MGSSPRHDTVSAIRCLQVNELKVVMLTGDNEHNAAAIAREVGIEEFRSGLLPEDKHAEIERLQAAGEKVGMVGDGSTTPWPWPTRASPSARAPK